MNDMNPILYTIKPGDTLYHLAMQYGTTVQNIIDTNMALNPYDLRVGQQIYIYPNDAQNANYWISNKHQSSSIIRTNEFSMGTTYHVDTNVINKYCRKFKRFRGNSNAPVKKPKRYSRYF